MLEEEKDILHHQPIVKKNVSFITGVIALREICALIVMNFNLTLQRYINFLFRKFVNFSSVDLVAKINSVNIPIILKCIHVNFITLKIAVI